MAKVNRMSPEAIGVGTVMKERGFSSRSSRMQRLLGISVNDKLILSDLSDISELKEDDVWEGEMQDLPSFLLKGKTDSPPDAFRPDAKVRRGIGIENESGLSFVLGLSVKCPSNRLSTVSRLASAMTSNDYSRQCMASQSAPVKVPDWTKLFLQDKNKNERVEIAEDDAERLPPHEFLARTQVTSPSVLEGAGRTLKGRDLRRVRNTVWRQTGFDQ